MSLILPFSAKPKRIIVNLLNNEKTYFPITLNHFFLNHAEFIKLLKNTKQRSHSSRSADHLKVKKEIERIEQEQATQRKGCDVI